MNQTSVFEAKGVTKSFGDRIVLNGVSARFQQVEIVGILGPNGAGKTTFFSILAGIEFAESGTITLDNRDITKLKMWHRGREGIVYLPQDSSVFVGLSVEDNIKSILQIRYESREEIDEKLNKLLDAFSLLGLKKTKASLLSGGERRKVEIARALAADPKFLMLDEPFSGIDPISIHEIIEIMRGLKESGIGIIVTDHNVRETLTVLDRGYIIANGQIVVSGTADDILLSKLTRDIYLGDEFKI
jgi:lipopolysaccharide export system ATP-binding protein